MKDPSGPDPTADKLRAIGDDDYLNAAVHEAGHALALVGRGVEVVEVLIWDSLTPHPTGRWDGRTLSGDTDHLDFDATVMLALAGSAAEAAVEAADIVDPDEAQKRRSRTPRPEDSDYRDAAKLIWRHGQPGEPMPDSFLAEPAVVDAIATAWPQVVEEMAAQVEAIKHFAGAVLGSMPALYLDGDSAALVLAEIAES